MPGWLFNLAIVWRALPLGVTIVPVIRAGSITAPARLGAAHAAARGAAGGVRTA